MLKFPDFNELFYVTTDASNVAIGGMLSQGDPPNDRPIYFFSKTLNETQRRYSTIHKELFAIVEVIKAFRVYIYGRFFVLITDHKALCYLFSMKDCGSRLFRQKLEIMDYNFKIIYRPGAQNHVADALSRIEPLSIEEMIEIDKKKENFAVITRGQAQRENELKVKRIIVEEKEGTILRKINYDLVFHLIPKEPSLLREKIMNKFGVVAFHEHFLKTRNWHYYKLISNQFANRQNTNDTLKCINEILKICQEEKVKNIAINLEYDSIRHYIFFKNNFEEIFNPYDIEATFYLNKILELTEREDIDKIMDLYHYTVLGGHLGADKMYRTISRFYKWNNMIEEIKTFVKNCPICEKTKTHLNTKVPMQISSLGETLFDHAYMDFVGPIPPSLSNKKWIWTCTCDLTKMLVCVAVEDSTALTAANCLLEHVICRYNFPSRLISDNASNFTSQVIKELTNLFHIKKVFTTIYHPESSIVERQHRTLNAYLRAFTGKNKGTWDELLKFATFAYNNSVHSVTGFTPHCLAFGFNMQIPNHLTKPKLYYNYDSYASMVHNNIAKALEIARENLMTKKDQNKKYYDANAKECEINIGDLVLVKNKLKSHKFDDVYEGPFEVINAEDVYVEILRRGKRTKVHKNLIKLSKANHKDNKDISN